jgi:hypothetical protein
MQGQQDDTAAKPPLKSSFTPDDWGQLRELEAFQKKHGHCHVPRYYPPRPKLGYWVCNLRVRQKRLLPRGLAQRLQKIGFQWDIWEDLFSELEAYREKHGNCNVPAGWPKNRRLASWVAAQRRRRQKGTLSKARAKRLDEIGFIWDTRIREWGLWEARLAALAEFKKQYGHCNVSTLDKKHVSLGRWVCTQRTKRRRGLLSAERIAQLDGLGFDWDPGSVPR